jgi:hypothetical protein
LAPLLSLAIALSTKVGDHVITQPIALLRSLQLCTQLADLGLCGKNRGL